MLLLFVWLAASSPCQPDNYPCLRAEAIERERVEIAKRRDRMLRETMPSGCLTCPDEAGGRH